MTTRVLIVMLSILLAASKGENSSSGPAIYYQYGRAELPGSMAPLNSSYRAKDLDQKIITIAGHTHAPINILSQDLTLSFDVTQQKIIGTSVIQFKVERAARPYFELSGTVLDIELNQRLSHVIAITDPDGLGQNFWSLDEDVLPDTQHELQIKFELPLSRVSLVNGGVRALTNMTDLNAANFFENWAPVAFEDDQFALKLTLKVMGGSSQHRLFTNGKIVSSTRDEWTIDFPHYFTKSSFYFHLTNNNDLVVQEFVYPGIEKNIPVLVYSSRADLVSEAVATLPSLFAEFESDYGPYPHGSFTVYMNYSGGGMEYSGATITSLAALDHELFHSWFARSIIPADGRSGWIDEAMASWRDYGYFQAASLLERAPTNLSSFSAFRKSTPSNCYRDGRQFMAELDRLFQDYGGMKQIMRAYFQRYRNRVMSNEEFWNFLEELTLSNVDAYFHRYTLGFSSAPALMMSREKDVVNDSKHPQPLSHAEVLELR